MRRKPFIGLCLLFFVTADLFGVEHVKLQRDGRVQHVVGRIEVEAQDGGLLLMDRAGTLWALQPDEISSRRSDEVPFAALTKEELIEQTLSELPDGFAVHRTAHYAILYNTNKAYAQWCGSLYERLYRGFYNYWRKRGLKLETPVMPLVAIVFENKSAYVDFARPELGESATAIVGYYSLRTNRVTTFDLTGRADLRTAQGRPRSAAIVNQILSQPLAAPTVATIIHEATHQLAYNSGLQTRYADNPLWLSEGLAIYFETPDLASSRGWRSIGTVNLTRLGQFRSDLARRSPRWLERLLTQDDQLREASTAVSSYAEAWGLCYFLARRYEEALAAYLTELSGKRPLAYDTPEQRLATFEKYFGEVAKIEQELVTFLMEM